jgi:hypothetical protein
VYIPTKKLMRLSLFKVGKGGFKNLNDEIVYEKAGEYLPLGGSLLYVPIVSAKFYRRGTKATVYLSGYQPSILMQ